MCFDISLPLAPLFCAVFVNGRLHIYTSELASFLMDGRKTRNQALKQTPDFLTIESAVYVHISVPHHIGPM